MVPPSTDAGNCRTQEAIPVAEILKNEYWYGNRVRWPEAPSWELAWRFRYKLAKSLVRKPQLQLRPDVDQLALAARLAGCRPGARCYEGACPECGRGFQGWTTKRTGSLASAGGAYAVTIVPADTLCEELTAECALRVLRSIRKVFEESDLIEWGVLGLDLSFNDFRCESLDPGWPAGVPRMGWQPHVYALVQPTDWGTLRKLLDERFPAGPGVEIPVKGGRYKGGLSCPSYILKCRFQSRFSYRTDQGLCSFTPDLPVHRELELRRVLSEIGLAGRIELIGLKVRTTSKRIVLEPAK